MNSEFNETELRRLDLNLLLTFAAVMRERSVTRAAEKLFVGPPAVSMALRRLRDLFGDLLFVRTSTTMEPTARALAIYARLTPALADIAATLREAEAFDPAVSHRIIRFASPDDLEIALVPRLLARLASEAPHLRLTLRSADFRHVPDMLFKDEIDLALTAKPADLVSALRWRKLHDERFLALLDPAVTALPSALTIESYLSVPHVFLSTQGDRRGPIDDDLAARGLKRDILASVPRFSTTPFILKARASLINMPATAARHYASAFSLETRELPFPSPNFEVGLVSHARAEGDKAVTWFAQAAAEELEKLR